jgi:hypothetical protein
MANKPGGKPQLNDTQYHEVWSDLDAGMSMVKTAAKHGVSSHMISDVFHGRTYKELFAKLDQKMVKRLKKLATSRQRRKTPIRKETKLRPMVMFLAPST